MTMRIVQVKFNAGEQGRAMATLEEAERVFPTIPGVTAFQCGPAAEGNTDYDLAFLVEFDAIEDVEAYRVDPIHEKFADKYMRPYAIVVARNYEI